MVFTNASGYFDLRCIQRLSLKKKSVNYQFFILNVEMVIFWNVGKIYIIFHLFCFIVAPRKLHM